MHIAEKGQVPLVLLIHGFSESWPGRVRALVNLSVACRTRSREIKPTKLFDGISGKGFYISQSQEPGRAEKSLANAPDLPATPPVIAIIDFLETHLHCRLGLLKKFQETGLTVALNYYAAMDINWDLLARRRRANITVPTKLIAGSKYVGFLSFATEDCVNGEIFRELLPSLEVVFIVDRYFIQPEKAELVSNQILSFFSKKSLP